MALDTRYRPARFDDVIGQDNTVKVLRQFVHTGSGFHQSYLFCGAWGSGKTTLGRILARALLCESPQNGDPCDKCFSCTSILETGASECFVEVDAASHSGTADMQSMTESLQFDTFSGRRRIYLFDEAHRLTKGALDALLKPMEDTSPGSDDKLLVCIFCTTEPEKMRTTIFSRCAPAFVIRRVTPAHIAERLAFVCQQEGITYEQEALVTIAEVTECHIRDALKNVEGVSMLGAVTLENVRSYLRLNANAIYLQLLGAVGVNLPLALTQLLELKELVSPGIVYERLAEISMLAYRVKLGVGKPPSYWPETQLQALGDQHGDSLIRMAQVFASKPGHPTFDMLECDVANIHHLVQAGIPVSTHGSITPLHVVMSSPAPAPAPREALPLPQEASLRNFESDAISNTAPQQAVGTVERVQPSGPIAPPKDTRSLPRIEGDGTYVDPRGIRKKAPSDTSMETARAPLNPVEFHGMLVRLLAEMDLDGRRRST